MIKWSYSFLLLTTMLSSPLDAEEKSASGGDVDVTLEDSLLVLGKDASSRVEIVPPGDATSVAVFARHGTVDQIEIDDRGHVVASYSPPTQFIPRVDVIACRVETSIGPLWGYTSIILVGQGTAEIKTSPKALATIEIGDRKFGPVRANRKGKAKIHVEVPPGISTGVDGEGQSVDLHVPPVSRVSVFSGSQEAGGEDKETADLFIVVLTPEGELDGETEPLLESDGGEISGLKGIGDGTWSASFTPDKEASGLVKIFARAKGEDLPPSFASVLVKKEGGFEGESKAAAVSLKREDKKKEEEKPDEDEGQGAEDESSVLFSASITAGYAWNLGTLHGPSFGADALVFLPIADGNLALGVEGGLFFGSNETNVAQVSSVNSRTLMVPFMVKAAYRLEVSSLVGMIFSLKGGASMMQHSMDFSEGGTKDTKERIYSGVAGGAVALTLSAGPGAFALKVGYLYLFSKLETLEGNTSPASLEIGYRFYF